METIPQDLAEKIDSLEPNENLSDICFTDGKPNIVGKLLLELYDRRKEIELLGINLAELRRRLERTGFQKEMERFP